MTRPSMYGAPEFLASLPKLRYDEFFSRMMRSPFAHELNFHGPDPMATEVPKPDSFLLESQMIDEKLSARKEIRATNGFSNVN